MEDGTSFRNIKETYKIGETIGKGGFAFVRKAKNRKTGQHVAIKIY
jgi:serine/threonine protein kinase